MNARVKFREAFRPFAPAILEECAEAWFELDGVTTTSPFMLRIPRFRSEQAPRVPAVVHVDGTGRMQTVSAEDDPLFHALLVEFARRTGVPILLNTSFNAMGETIAETPEDALWCLLTTGMDACVLGDRLVTKAPGYRDLLGLSPHLVARARRPLPLSLAAAAAEALPFSVEIRWGPAHATVPATLVPVLFLMDGARTGREILETGSAALDGFPDEAELRCDLQRLWRARVVRFGRPAEIRSP